MVYDYVGKRYLDDLPSGQSAADKLKHDLNRSLYNSGGDEVELFKDVDFVEHGVKDADVYFNNTKGISETVNLGFLEKYLVHSSREMLVFKIPTSIEFDLNTMKLRQYFKQVSVGTFKNDKSNYMLRLYLFRNLTYQYRLK